MNDTDLIRDIERNMHMRASGGDPIGTEAAAMILLGQMEERLPPFSRHVVMARAIERHAENLPNMHETPYERFNVGWRFDGQDGACHIFACVVDETLYILPPLPVAATFPPDGD